MNIKKKFLIILILISFTILLVYLNNFESHASTDLMDDMNKQASTFLDKGNKKTDAKIINGVTKNFKGLGKILTTVVAGVMVIVVTYMGIKYMISPPDKQAALKQQLIGVVVSGIVIFGAYGIWSMLVTFLDKATK